MSAENDIITQVLNKSYDFHLVLYLEEKTSGCWESVSKMILKKSKMPWKKHYLKEVTKKIIPYSRWYF